MICAGHPAFGGPGDAGGSGGLGLGGGIHRAAGANLSPSETMRAANVAQVDQGGELNRFAVGKTELPPLLDGLGHSRHPPRLYRGIEPRRASCWSQAGPLTPASTNPRCSLAIAERLSQITPLTQLFNPRKANAVPVAAQFNGIVSGRPASAWGISSRASTRRIQPSSLWHSARNRLLTPLEPTTPPARRWPRSPGQSGIDRSSG
jgi:hypothetical protein